MSTFKRHKSKMFWRQMATHDLENKQLLVEENSIAIPDKSLATELCELNCHTPEKKLYDERLRVHVDTILANEAATSTFVATETKESDDLIPSTLDCIRTTQEGSMSSDDRERSCTFLTHDPRSQDSGFSDSDRSNCSEISGRDISLKWKHRKRRLKQRKEPEIRRNYCSNWLYDKAVPNSMCTSTPKDHKLESYNIGNFSGQSERSIRRIDRSRINSENILVTSPTTLGDEYLGDFLYAVEPPEDTGKENSINISVITSSCEKRLPCKFTLDSKNHWPTSSVQAWLNNLVFATDSECCNALQSKTLPRRKTSRTYTETEEMKDLKVLSSLATAAASKLLVRAEQFDQHYRYIYGKVSQLDGSKSGKDYVRAIKNDAISILAQLGVLPSQSIRQTNIKGTLVELEGIKNHVNAAIDTRLDFYIERVVRGLEEAPKDDTMVARGTLAALTALGLAGPRAGNSIARCCGIRALLMSLITVGKASTDYVAASLRALSSVCCSPTAIDRFAEDGGPEIVTDLLSAKNTSEIDKTEATALIVQITAPWTQAYGLQYVEDFADILVPSLNKLLESTNCAQTLLLVTAALNNLSKSLIFAELIIKHDTVPKLLKSVKDSTRRNVWLMEQVAALIGELARVPEARSHLAKARASVALISFLRMRPPGLEDAYRRLEVTAATALTRLCVSPEIARQVVAVCGEDCLPYWRENDLITKNGELNEAAFFKYTKSLRRACKKAAKQIDIAKTSDQQYSH